MSCFLNLYKIYEANQSFVGVEEERNGRNYSLLPISHTTQTAHIEVTVTEDGNFHTAEIISNKNERETVIPCTEASASRAGAAVAPYPLHDKISYVAGDFVAFGGKIKDSNDQPFSHYIANLKLWAESQYTQPQIRSIYTYLKKSCLIKDLIDEHILWLDENGKLIDKWKDQYKSICGGEKPEIFSIVAGGQYSTFIRFGVYTNHENKLAPKVWKNKDIYNSFIKFYSHQLSDRDLCYVTGQFVPFTERHANKIRNSGDKAKLISANDTSGFTFRGLFQTSHEAANISYEVSQKAHNALKWLIRRQGKIIDNRVFLVWTVSGEELPDPDEDFFDLANLTDNKEEIVEQTAFTDQAFAEQFRRAIDGLRNDLSHVSEVNILILDSATTGRMAILYDRNIQKEIYLKGLQEWHAQCIWKHRYVRKKDKKLIEFIGAPSTIDIAYAAYGPNANEKVIKETIERLLPCIVDCRHVPKDIVTATFNRAVNPLVKDQYEWEKTLSIACALINRQEQEYERKRVFKLALDEQLNDRSYLFGRLLAIADVLEHRALRSEDWRMSNAMRYMNDFAKHPERTWAIIQANLIPYQAKLSRGGWYLTQLIDQVGAMFQTDEFNDRPLSGKFLLGFYSQRHQLYQKKSEEPLAAQLEK
ncbi:type I-C CRISPR-associated protein Cas8c/Csd1 [Sporolactobacillus shoreicorticis]|uniref:Type I-C CRISPR-associated protein Cas8c/Csd1 n=1 Tax=Sporolactobacillus shoreicorticis TaxID=1923877 RepID=A0ABW5S8T6_9BACL|nr:type I-C CRISPR-associated protein Cas8c/Csd1 [Sporolactobacillus shoreicorticis]MCO7126963.1 type I-C CRISPR-associated protein Cas8c/Csd1 [Sporolactobacillus shoreicorticis]